MSGFGFRLTSLVLAGVVCGLPVDVYVVQDTTASFASGRLNAIVGGLVAGLSGLPADSRYGLVEMKDKPYHYLGDVGDVCYRKVSALAADSAGLVSALGSLTVSGGGDEADAQFTALAETAINGEWTDGRLKLIVLNTDSLGHNPNDFRQYAYNPVVPEPRPPFEMPPYPDVISGTVESRCNQNDYPTPFQTAQNLSTRGIRVAFLIPQTAPQAISQWSGFSKGLLAQPDGFVLAVNDDYSNYADVLRTAVANYLAFDQPTPAPTPAPTQPATTTTVATTVGTTLPPTTVPPTTTPSPPPTYTDTTTTTTSTTPSSPTTAAPVTTTAATTAAPVTTGTPTTPVTTSAPTTAAPVTTTVTTTTASVTTPATPTAAPVTTAAPTTTAPATTLVTSTLPPVTASTPTGEEGRGRPALQIRVNARPARLSVDYEA